LRSKKVPCDICGERRAAFVCSRCGRKVCQNCFDASSWLCLYCLKELGKARQRPIEFPAGLLVLAVALFLIGALLIAVGAMMSGPPAVWFWPPFFFVMTGSTAIAFAILALVLFVASALLIIYAIIKFLLSELSA